MTETIRPNRYGNPSEPAQEPNAADDFTRWAGDYLLGTLVEPSAEAVDAPPALGDVDPAEILERLHPGRAARLAAEADKAANADRFGEWAAERFGASSDSPESQDLARFLNNPRTN
ncbi:hypothetical protein ACH9DO_13795 [Kocuria sp. M1N1S27]|uniref:hypothetical protein n=1 Tax=Kocuria kalidii TaxID=3376283 RepID=UPI00379F1ECE